MAEKKGLLSRLFGGDSKSSCCSIRIEEIPEDEQSKQTGLGERADDANAPEATSSCCCNGKAPQGKGCC